MSYLWGDDWFEKYGNDLYDAESFIVDYVYKWSLCRLMSKEKYGTIRYERIFPPFSNYSFGPHLYIPFWKKQVTAGSKTVLCTRFVWIWNCSWLHNKWAWWGWKTCYKAVKLAIKKWPYLEHELLADLASNENLVGVEIHKKYWRSIND